MLNLNDVSFLQALVKLQDNQNFNIILGHLEAYRRELNDRLIEKDDPEVRGCLKLMLDPFLRKVGRAEFDFKSLIDRSRQEAAIEYKQKQKSAFLENTY